MVQQTTAQIAYCSNPKCRHCGMPSAFALTLNEVGATAGPRKIQ
jgi:hypothetical protein